MASENSNQDSLFKVTNTRSPTEASPMCMKLFDDIIVNFMKEQGIPGATVALSYKGQQIYKQGYGMASLDRKVHPDSVFRVASISKTLTAIGILTLWQQKKLDLSATVFGPKGILNSYKSTSKGDHRINRITVKHLLQHSGGWDRDQAGDAVFWNLDNIFKNKEMSLEDKLLRFMMSKKLQFTPGKRHSYSNLGYLILGKVIEKVEQKSYTEFLKDILKKINIVAMTTGHNNDCCVINNDEVNYFHKSWLELKNPGAYQGWILPHSNLVQMDGAKSYGGWVANASDVLRIFNSLSDNEYKLLNDEAIRMMLNRPEYENGNEWYGLGLEVEDNGCSWGHTGAMEGTSCTGMRDKSGLMWVLLFNAWSKDMDLNGLMRYAISTIPNLPLWHEGTSLSDSSINISTDDGEQVVAVIIPHHLLQTHIDKMSLNYKIHWLSSHQLNNKAYFNIVWRRSNSSSQFLVCLDVSVDDIDAVVTKQQDLGFSVKQLETYRLEGHLKFLLVFENVSVVPQKIYSYESPEEHLARISELKKSGWRLIIQSLVSIDDCLVVSSVYDKTDPDIKTVSWLGITLDNFLFELNKQINNRLSLIYVKFFNSRENFFVSAIWNSKQERNYWQRHSVSRYGFLYELRKASAKNLYIDYISSYVEDAVVNFAAFWPSLG